MLRGLRGNATTAADATQRWEPWCALGPCASQTGRTLGLRGASATGVPGSCRYWHQTTSTPYLRRSRTTLARAATRSKLCLGFRVIKYPLLVRRAHEAFREKLNRHIRSYCIQLAAPQFAYPLEQGLEREALPMAKMRGGRHRATRALRTLPTHAT